MAQKRDKADVPVDIGGGLNQAVDPKKVQPPFDSSVDNCRISTRGVIEKRLGYENLSTTGYGTFTVSGGDYTLPEGGEVAEPSSYPAVADVGTIFSHRGQIGVLTADGIWTLDEQEGEWYQPTTNSLANTRAKSVSFGVGRYAASVDIAQGNNIICVVWDELEQGSAVWYMFLDAETLDQVAPPQRITTNLIYNPRVVFFNGTFVLFGQDGKPSQTSPHTLYFCSYGEAAGTYEFSTPTTTGRAVYEGDYDVSAGGSLVVLATRATATGTGNVVTYNSTLTQQNLLVVTAATTYDFDSVAVYYDSADARIYWTSMGNSDDWFVSISNETLSSVTNHVLLSSGDRPGWISATDNRYSITHLENDEVAVFMSERYVRSESTSGTGTTVGDGFGGTIVAYVSKTGTISNHILLPGVSLASRAVQETSTPLAENLVFASHTGANTALRVGGTYGDAVWWQPYPAMAFHKMGVSRVTNENDAKTISYPIQNPAIAWSADDDEHKSYLTPLLRTASNRLLSATATIVEDGVNSRRSKIVLTRLETSSSREVDVVITEDGTLLGGGTVGHFDGVRGAPCTPPIVPVPLGFVSGSVTPGTYDYALTFAYVYQDSYGRLHHGPLSPVSLYSHNASSWRPHFKMWCPQWVAHNGDAGRLYCAIYASEGALTSNGEDATGYTRRLVSMTELTTRDSNEQSFSVQSETTIQVLASGTIDPVQAGELSSDPTLSPRSLAVVANRAFYIPPDGSKVYYSKPKDDVRSWEFNDAAYLPIPPFGGLGEALAGIDDKLFVLCERAVYVLSAHGGPDRNGSGTFPTLRILPGNIGCSQPQSVVSSPVGVFFQGQRGIYLITRSAEIQFIGETVKTETDGMTVTSANEVPSASEVRFHLDAGVANATKTVLVFNYVTQTWTKHTSVPSVSAWNADRYLVMETTGQVCRETDDYYHAVTGTEITHDWESPWYNLAGVAGFERLKKITIEGHHYTAPVRVRVYVDYDDSTAVDTFTFAALDDNSRMSLRIRPSRQKVAALKIRVDQSSASSGTREGFDLQGLHLEVQVKSGGYKTINTFTGE